LTAEIAERAEKKASTDERENPQVFPIRVHPR